MFRTVSFVVTDDRRDGPALRAAARIARRETAHLDLFCVAVEPVPLEAVSIDAPVLVMDWGVPEARERAKALASWAWETVPAELSVRAEPVTIPALGLAPAAGRLARFSDLVVMRRPYGIGVGALAPVILKGVLLGSLAPVLVLPDDDRADWDRPLGRLCLAWDDSDEALRAAHAALPLLRAAKAVDIVIVDPPIHASDETDPSEVLALWLARHGVQPEITLLARTEPRVTDLLTHFCTERGCDALVMGAFGHSRLREEILGGTTREMLASVPLPLFLAH